MPKQKIFSRYKKGLLQKSIFKITKTHFNLIQNLRSFSSFYRPVLRAFHFQLQIPHRPHREGGC